jgi:hypothetical protein
VAVFAIVCCLAVGAGEDATCHEVVGWAGIGLEELERNVSLITKTGRGHGRNRYIFRDGLCRRYLPG